MTASDQGTSKNRVEQVVRHIREAFRGVTLGRGVGLFEAQGLDNYSDEATRNAYRERDEKNDWQRIPTEDLNECNSSLSFFDAEGMRFHLPAYMIGLLNDRVDRSFLYHLTHLDDFAKSKLADLTTEQRNAVQEFLVFLMSSADYELYRPRIERALSYWRSNKSKEN
jgi:hypothetical protein